MQSHGKLCKEANKTSSQTAHLFIRVLASLHCNVGCPVNGEEMRFTSWEEMVRDDHPPIHLVTSSEFHICVPSVATDERGCASCIMDELERMEARRTGWWRSYHGDANVDERSFAVPLCYLFNEAP